MRYWYILLTTIFFSCNTNSPEEAAKEYCECLNQQYSNRVDTRTAFGYCDSLIAMRYKELHTYCLDKNPSEANWRSAVDFYNKFFDVGLRNCCALIGNCDTFSFRDSLIKHFSTYFFREDNETIDYVRVLLRASLDTDIIHKYKIDDGKQLLSLSAKNRDSSCFNYEIVIFDNKRLADSVIALIRNHTCQQKLPLRIMSYKRIDDSTLFLCNYYNFDFDRMKSLLDRTFRGSPTQDVGDN